ncbi:T9SS type A sorting domain-containing protein [Fulvivirgaceae bacterium PWU5]|uniref:T9SS type A sorting domain-containing protein n=1 Tax=Dawidia cretensis TaxID=2782350 RepID=A0AAP2GWC2_9BACT|nr:T9SS type A sorting domain-containing protein [Dawidia cretensis]MBT1712125.1 T9SS type A sorting domain-containing protein [Dawidia cretensis]
MIKRCTIFPRPERPFSVPGAGLTLLLVCLLTTASVAQLTRGPLPRAPRQQRQGARVSPQVLETRSLPFWEDFSFTVINDTSHYEYISDYPLDSMWYNSKSVLISNGGWNAPSVNVATLDGLDLLGIPYSNDNMLNGFRDTLMSHAFEMTAVPEAQRNTVFLSFFYQWQGHGEPPDPNDYLQLQFLNNDSIWENVMRILPKESFQPDVFYDTIIPISAAKYYHDEFQFRFLNYGRKSGPFDTWNIDYIYLNKNRALNDNSFPERAIASPATQLFGQYYAMPIQHFREYDKTIGPVQFDVKNMKNQANAISISYVVNGTFSNYSEGATTPYSTLVGQATIKGELGGFMDPFERVRVNVPYENLPDTTNTSMFDPAADSIRIKLTLSVTGDTDDPQAPSFAPVDFTSNDTLSVVYWLKDYYAYDDGTAEYSARMASPENKVAYAFDLAPGQTDTLAGFYAYFPVAGLTGNRSADFTIYGETDGLPDNNKVLYAITGKSIQRRDVNQFQRIDIPEVVLVRDRFYIAFGNSAASIGLDVSQDTHDKIFDYVNQIWEPNDRITGSLMIRPIFGKGSGENPVTGIDPEETATPVHCYPNPSNGSFYIDSRHHEVMRVISITGQPISFETEVKGDGQQVTLRQPVPGLYILQLRHGDSFWSHKILVR